MASILIDPTSRRLPLLPRRSSRQRPPGRSSSSPSSGAALPPSPPAVRGPGPGGGASGGCAVAGNLPRGIRRGVASRRRGRTTPAASSPPPRATARSASPRQRTSRPSLSVAGGQSAKTPAYRRLTDAGCTCPGMYSPSLGRVARPGDGVVPFSDAQSTPRRRAVPRPSPGGVAGGIPRSDPPPPNLSPFLPRPAPCPPNHLPAVGAGEAAVPAGVAGVGEVGAGVGDDVGDGVDLLAVAVARAEDGLKRCLFAVAEVGETSQRRRVRLV